MSKKKLVWIDMEMTGLDPAEEVILEVAIMITDHDCNILYPGSSYVIHQSEEILKNMNAWCKDMHTKNGLITLVQKSEMTIDKVKQQLVKIIQKYVQEKNGLLAGNSIWQDRSFLAKYIPEVLALLHYRLLDVSTIKEMAMLWYGESVKYQKKETHRALDDIVESISELIHYRELLFIKPH